MVWDGRGKGMFHFAMCGWDAGHEEVAMPTMENDAIDGGGEDGGLQAVWRQAGPATPPHRSTGLPPMKPSPGQLI
jgi:hypothetical protein